jgi:hypothetical protein
MKTKHVVAAMAALILATLLAVACATTGQRFPNCLTDSECHNAQKCVEQVCITPPRSN